MILSKTELKILKKIPQNYTNIKELTDKEINLDQIRRAIEYFKTNNLIELKEEKIEIYKPTALGKKFINNEFPQEKLIKEINETTTMQDIAKKYGKEAGLMIGLAKKEGLINIENGKIKLLKNKEELLEKYKKLHEILKNPDYDELALKEKLIEKSEKKEIFVKINENGAKLKNKEIKPEVNELTQEMLISGEWKKVEFKKYNVVADVEPKYGAKFQPYKRFLDLIRKKLISMGFEEMETSLTTTEFYNFDVLFQPQNHPARTWTDTYSLKTPNKGELPKKEIVDKIKKAHETGGDTLSKGWRYKWNPEIAMKLMPAAHGTAFSAKKMVSGVKIPGRYFALARVYRPDVLDATHLNEFNQLEGFVVAKDVSFKHLLGMLANFAKEIAGTDEILFYPDYYPFTEPSVQLSAKHPKLGWVEFGGAGIFRPEITENLGIKERVIAWGLGIDRLAMFNLGIHDIRQLFSNKIDWLRKKPIVEKI